MPTTSLGELAIVLHTHMPYLEGRRRMAATRAQRLRGHARGPTSRLLSRHHPQFRATPRTTGGVLTHFGALNLRRIDLYDNALRAAAPQAPARTPYRPLDSRNVSRTAMAA